MIQKFPVSVLATAALLVGCGGGGGGSSTPNTPDGGLNEFDTVFLTVSDTEQASRYIRDQFAYGQAQIVGDTSAFNDLSFDGQDVIVDPLDVDRPTTFAFDLVNDELGKVANLRILVDNTSGKPLENIMTGFIAQREDILALDETFGAFSIAVDTAYLEGSISATEQTAMKTGFNPAGSAEYAEAEAGANAIETALEEYRQGAISESELNAAFTSGLSAIDALAAYGQQQIDSAFVASGMTPVPIVGDLSADQDRLTISRYIGNSGFGAYAGDNWNYSTSFDYFNLIR